MKPLKNHFLDFAADMAGHSNNSDENGYESNMFIEMNFEI